MVLTFDVFRHSKYLKFTIYIIVRSLNNYLYGQNRALTIYTNRIKSKDGGSRISTR